MRRESGAMPSALALDAPQANGLECPMAMTYFHDAAGQTRSRSLIVPHPIAVTSRRHVEKFAPPFLADKRDIS